MKTLIIISVIFLLLGAFLIAIEIYKDYRYFKERKRSYRIRRFK